MDFNKTEKIADEKLILFLSDNLNKTDDQTGGEYKCP